MKLIKCYVSAFGALTDYTYDFNGGLNTVKEDNGWGKSTFATFIKAMFYGLNDSKRSVSDNERLKYKPWNSSQRFGGYVAFEWGGKQFKIERFFGSKESEDSVKLFDLETGKEFSATDNLGKRIFEIDEEGFLSTTYFSQKDFEIKSNTSITAKFNSVCEIQDTEAFDSALNRIEEKAKTYKYRGDRGLIPDTKRQIRTLDEEILKAEKAVFTMNALKDEVATLTEQAKALDKLDKELSAKIEQVSRQEAIQIKKARYSQLVKEKAEYETTLTNAKEVLNGNAVDRAKILELQNKNRELFGVNAQIKTVEDDLQILKNQPQEKIQKSFPLYLVGYAFSALFLLVAISLNIALGNASFVIVSYMVSALVAVISVVTNIIQTKGNKSDSDDGVAILFDSKTTALNDLIVKKQTIESEIDSYIEKFSLSKIMPDCDRSTALDNILRIYDVCASVNNNLLAVNKELDSLKDVAKIELAKETESIEGLKTRQLEIDSQLRAKLREIESKRSSVRIYEDMASSFPDLESKKSELEQNIKDYEEKQNILTLTAKFLKQADENLKIKYKAPLQSSLNKYFDFVTGGKKTINIDIDLKVSVEEGGEQKSTEYYSKGYQNLFEICKRFALVDVLFTKEKPFIILDDPFYNLDDDKLSLALEMIKKLSEEYQILYFICHDSRRC